MCSESVLIIDCDEDKMNIFYYGVDNPISFSVNGYDSKQLILKACCGELRKNEDGYVWKMWGEKEATVSFNSFLKRGNKMIALGQSDYRIKKVPHLLLNLVVQIMNLLKVTFTIASMLTLHY